MERGCSRSPSPSEFVVAYACKLRLPYTMTLAANPISIYQSGLINTPKILLCASYVCDISKFLEENCSLFILVLLLVEKHTEGG